MEDNSVLIINKDDEEILNIILELEDCYSLYTAQSLNEGLDLYTKFHHKVVVIDASYDQNETIELVKKLKQSNKVSVIITGDEALNQEALYLAANVNDFILKPYNIHIFKLRIENQLNLINLVYQIEAVGMTDKLTGLQNRRSFDEKIELLWRSSITNNHNISLAILDIDHFKKFNDTYGHQVGDLVLQEVSKIIKKSLKRHSDFLFRWGGEEFTMLFYNLNKDKTRDICELVRKNIQNSNLIYNGQIMKITVSIGAFCNKAHKSESIKYFIEKADERVYKAKEEGRNKVFVN